MGGPDLDANNWRTIDLFSERARRVMDTAIAKRPDRQFHDALGTLYLRTGRLPQVGNSP